MQSWRRRKEQVRTVRRRKIIQKKNKAGRTCSKKMMIEE